MPDKAYGALAPPLYLSTTFERSADGSYPLGFEYARDDNPNRHDFEHAISEMEAGVDAAAFASGSAAIMTLFQALRPGDRVIVSHDCYYGVRQMLTRFRTLGLTRRSRRHDAAFSIGACARKPSE